MMARSGANQKLSAEEIAKIRLLDDFDLIMLISEIHDHGWPVAAVTLGMMPIELPDLIARATNWVSDDE